ncbi:hypothetical protein [Microbacterium lacticum]
MRDACRRPGLRWDATQGTYVLPLKRSVRDAHGIGTGGVVGVWIEVLDA